MDAFLAHFNTPMSYLTLEQKTPPVSPVIGLPSSNGVLYKAVPVIYYLYCTSKLPSPFLSIRVLFSSTISILNSFIDSKLGLW